MKLDISILSEVYNIVYTVYNIVLLFVHIPFVNIFLFSFISVFLFINFHTLDYALAEGLNQFPATEPCLPAAFCAFTKDPRHGYHLTYILYIYIYIIFVPVLYFLFSFLLSFTLLGQVL